MKEFPLFSQRLRETRIKMGLTQAELAKLTGATPATISAYEKGKSPSLEIVSDIAQQLNVSIDYLLGVDKNAPIGHKANREELYRAIITIVNSTYTNFLYHEFTAAPNAYDGVSISSAIDFLDSDIEAFLLDLYKAKPILDDEAYDEFLKQSVLEGVLKKHLAIYAEKYSLIQEDSIQNND